MCLLRYAKLPESGIVIAKNYVNGRHERSHHVPFPAKPMQPFKEGAGLIFPSGAGQCIGMNGCREV